MLLTAVGSVTSGAYLSKNVAVGAVNEEAYLAVRVMRISSRYPLKKVSPAAVAPTRTAVGAAQAVELVIDESTYTARLRGRPLDLTYKEFELLKYLAQHAGRVFTRAQLLQEVWGYDFFGGTRTVDVHVRRLRAKLGPEYEALIGTVRNVGYKAVRPARGRSGNTDGEPADADEYAGADDADTGSMSASLPGQ